MGRKVDYDYNGWSGDDDKYDSDNEKVKDMLKNLDDYPFKSGFIEEDMGLSD